MTFDLFPIPGLSSQRFTSAEPVRREVYDFNKKSSKDEKREENVKILKMSACLFSDSFSFVYLIKMYTMEEKKSKLTWR